MVLVSCDKSRLVPCFRILSVTILCEPASPSPFRFPSLLVTIVCEPASPSSSFRFPFLLVKIYFRWVKEGKTEVPFPISCWSLSCVIQLVHLSVSLSVDPCILQVGKEGKAEGKVCLAGQVSYFISCWIRH